jgi:hypothetical protein
MASKKEKQRQENRKAGRVQYDLPPETKDDVAALAEELGVPQSQVAALLLEHGLEAVKKGEVDLSQYLVPSRSPLFDYNLNLEKFRKDKKKK